MVLLAASATSARRSRLSCSRARYARGYGQTDRPTPLEAYDIFQLTGDIVGLVNALGEPQAAIVGHDWGAWITAHAALLRPDLFHALALLSVPYVPRGPLNQSEWEQRKYPGKMCYQAFLRSPAADQILQADVRSTLLRGLYTLSGDASPEERWSPVTDPDARSFASPAPLKRRLGLPVKTSISWKPNTDALALLAASIIIGTWIGIGR